MSSHTRLFVGNVPENINETELQQAFSSYGQIINVDLKSKSNAESDPKKFAFITLSGSHYEVESCIKHFSSEDFAGRRLYVTRARESFLERLQRERSEAERKQAEKTGQVAEDLPKRNPVIKLGDKLNPRKRKLDHHHPPDNSKAVKVIKPFERKNHDNHTDLHHHDKNETKDNTVLEKDKKKTDSDKKRIESLKKKRQEFKEKQMIIKSGLVGVDKVPNKKVIFPDNEEDSQFKPVNGYKNNVSEKSNNVKNSLFEDDESDDDVNFEVKKQFEGKKGQKVLDLQSRYKLDKRFVLDERFMEDGHSEDEDKQERADDDEGVDLVEADQKTKELNILQNVLGVAIKARPAESDSRKTKSKLGMLRFDPTQPEHAKFLAPRDDTKEELSKKSKKKKKDKNQEAQDVDKIATEVEKVEVSKEQFYKVSETLKETLEQPTSFSLRSLFGQKEENNEKEVPQQDYIPLQKTKDSKVKNPLDTSGRNPFVYDSSESEDEEPVMDVKMPETQEVLPSETKAVWKENLFFSKLDNRLQEGLAFFNKSDNNEVSKQRRELKSVMKKRIYNKDRKNQMFQKKIGGRKKSMKKSYKMKS